MLRVAGISKKKIDWFPVITIQRSNKEEIRTEGQDSNCHCTSNTILSVVRLQKLQKEELVFQILIDHELHATEQQT